MTTWVLFTGLPGTGKSTLARALEHRLNGAQAGEAQPRAVTLDKDCLRNLPSPGR